VPVTVSFPEAVRVVNDPVEAMVAPIGVLLIEPPVMVAPEEAKVFAVVDPFRETVPVPVENVPLPDCTKFPVAVRFVNLPVEAVVAPIGILSIEPPLRVAPDEANVFAVVEPLRVVVPLTPSELLKVVAPVTPSEPPKVVPPLPTENAFDPLTLVGPFKETAPLPVEKVVEPLWATLVAKFKFFPLVSKVTNGEPTALVNLNALVESVAGVKVALGALPLKVKVVAPTEVVDEVQLSVTS
jgi:hypothetical protein